jgi:hypothetical protein
MLGWPQPEICHGAPYNRLNKRLESMTDIQDPPMVNLSKLNFERASGDQTYSGTAREAAGTSSPQSFRNCRLEKILRAIVTTGSTPRSQLKTDPYSRKKFSRRTRDLFVSIFHQSERGYNKFQFILLNHHSPAHQLLLRL